MPTIAEQAASNYRLLTDRYWQKNGPTDSHTTFDQWRRVNAGVADDLGVPNDPWTKILSNQPCTINGLKEFKNRFEIDTEGTLPTNQLEMETSVTDIRPGDNVVLSIDGRAYSVEGVSVEGPIRYCVLDRRQAQVVP